MIDKALSILAEGIETYLSGLPELTLDTPDIVKVCNVVKADGTLEIPVDNLGLCLVNVEEERMVKSQYTVQTASDRSRLFHANPEIKLNLYLLLSAHYADYPTGLKFLSAAVSFFQAKNVFTAANTPGMRALRLHKYV